MEELELINEFTGEYLFLSNYFKCKITYNGYTYSSVEAAFQAQKNPDLSYRFVGKGPNIAKHMGRRVTLRPDWEDVKVDIMRELLEIKFSDSKLRKRLLSTYPKYLIEGNTWNDKFWGVDIVTGEGENHLGELLMQVRNELMDQ